MLEQLIAAYEPFNCLQMYCKLITTLPGRRQYCTGKLCNKTSRKMFHLIKRCISTTAPLSGKKNFRKFLLYNKRGTRIFKQQRAANPDLYADMPIDKRGVRETGVTIDGKFIEIPEKIPELIVPNLDNCKFKPYVSYKAPDVVQSEFTSQDLFNSVYAQKIISDWKSGKLNDDGSPIEPSKEEALSAGEAWARARKTGSDIF